MRIERNCRMVELSVIAQCGTRDTSKMAARIRTLCQTIRTKELLNSTNWPRTRIVPPPRTMGKKITRPDIDYELFNLVLKLVSHAAENFCSCSGKQPAVLGSTMLQWRRWSVKGNIGLRS